MTLSVAQSYESKRTLPYCIQAQEAAHRLVGEAEDDPPRHMMGGRGS